MTCFFSLPLVHNDLLLFPYTTLFRSASAASRRSRAASSSARSASSATPRTATASRPRCSRPAAPRSEEHTSELQSLRHLVCRLLLEKKNSKVGAVRAAVFYHGRVGLA